MVPANRDLTTDDTVTTDHSSDTAPTRITPNTANCPECGNAKISRTHRMGSLDRVISLINIYPYCCRTHTCQARFYRFGRRKQVTSSSPQVANDPNLLPENGRDRVDRN